jgi:hypothetical protein
MTRRFLILSLAAGLLALGGLNAQAGVVGLPTTLDNLLPAGSTAVVGDLTFSDFGYSTSTPPPTAAQVTVKPFFLPPSGTPVDTGISFSGGFFAPPGGTADYTITYEVTSNGAPITDAYLGITGGNNGGTGYVDVGESITTLLGAPVATLDAFVPGIGIATATFAPETTLLVTKDIFIYGGSLGATVSVINQGYSTAIPEPTSMALLGIGLSGLFTLRRLFKRTSVA